MQDMTVLQFAKMRQFKNFSPPVALIYSAAATSTFFTIGHKGVICLIVIILPYQASKQMDYCHIYRLTKIIVVVKKYGSNKQKLAWKLWKLLMTSQARVSFLVWTQLWTKMQSLTFRHVQLWQQQQQKKCIANRFFLISFPEHQFSKLCSFTKDLKVGMQISFIFLEVK